MLKPETVKIAEELREILSKITGVKSLKEELSLHYIVAVEKEEDKENVEKVASALEAQAQKYGFFIEITPATEEEIQKAREDVLKLMKQNATFEDSN